MERVSQYLATAFFFSFPLVFGGIPLFFGGEFPRGIAPYEGVRLVWAAACGTILAAPLIIRSLRTFRRFDPFRKEAVRSFWLPAVVCGSFLVSALFHPFSPASDLLFGRTYSVVAFLSLVAVTFGYRELSEEARKTALRWMVAGFVAFNFPYAVIQVLAFDPVTAAVVLPDWGEGRAFGTLGNPNSLAFFAAACLPLAFWLFSGKAARWAVVSGLVAIVVLAQSASALLVVCAYFAYRAFGWRGLTAVAISAITAFALSVNRYPDKFFSLQTRAAIAADVVERTVSNPRTFFVGDGSDAVAKLFSEYRSAEVVKFAGDAPIDRTHFLWLDVALAFGVPFTLSFLSWSFSRYGKTERFQKESLSVFFVLSLLHTPGIAHLLVFCALLSGRINVRPAPKKRRV